MKLIYKGKYKSENQLPKADLPQNAVRFKEPDNPATVSLVALLFCIPAFLLIAAAVIISKRWHGGIAIHAHSGWFLLGLLFSLFCMPPHEFLHGILFGKNAVVELFVVPSKLMAFVVSPQPISKGRFIFLSLFPNLVFGWIPFLVWTVLPYVPRLSDFLLYFSAFSIVMGGGDYMNVWNALRQMPKGSVQQLSGFHSYWYMP